ncbi:MAG TPA: hypothetical protein VF885_18110, partial [Arthrobacter sp.]
MTDSNGRLNSAMDELNAREDYIRSQRHLTDEELRAQLVDTLRKEKAVVDRWVDSGDCFIISAAGKVHLPSCPSMRAVVDREAAWAPYLDDLERARDWHGSDSAPPMPALLTRADVEDLARYTSCPVCAPTLDHTDKRPVARGWTLVQAGSLNFRHFGTAFSLADGTAVGTLTKISRVETADGLNFAAEFDGIVDPVTDPLIEL